MVESDPYPDPEAADPVDSYAEPSVDSVLYSDLDAELTAQIDPPKTGVKRQATTIYKGSIPPSYRANKNKGRRGRSKVS